MSVGPISSRRIGLFAVVCGLASVLVSAPTATAAPPASYLTRVVGAPLGEVVIDGAGRAYATNPSRNQVEVLSLATGTLEAPILVGSQPRGLDFSPDGGTLYVANSGASDVSVVNLSLRREVRRVTVPTHQFGNDRPFSIAVASTGLALLTTTFDGSGFGARMLSIDFTSDTVRERREFWSFGSTTEITRMKASGDRSRIGIVAGNISSGPVFLYYAATDTFTPEETLAAFVSFVALDGAGSTVLVNPGTYVLDGNLQLQATIPDGGHGVAVNASGTTGYRVQGGKVDVLDLGRGLVSATIPLAEGVGSGSGMVALSPDNATLAVLTATGISVARVSTAVPTPACAPPAAPPGVVAVCAGPLADVVVGGSGRAYATNPARNQVEVVSLATGTLEAPIPVGSQPLGLDLSADGTKLYVANSGGGYVSVVDLALRREVGRIAVPSGWTNDRPYSIAVAANGLALLTTTFRGSGFGARMYAIDLAAGTVQLRDDFFHWGSTTQVTRLEPSGDRSRIGIVAGDISSGPVFLYTAVTDTFTPEKDLATFVSFVALDAAGSKVLVSPGAYLLDGSLTLRATIPSGGLGVTVNAAGTKGYRVTPTAVDVLDLERALVVDSITLPEAVGSGPGTAALSPDGKTLAVLTAKGVSVMPSARTVQQAPYSVWAQPGSGPLDGVGAWVATANDPAAAAGQLAPTYVYGHYFGFADASPLGLVGLVKSPAGKFAVFTVVEEDGTAHNAVVAFDWKANRLYFPFVHQVETGRWAAWVYDYTVGGWVPIGAFALPPAWGKLAPTSITTVQWVGPTGARCSLYPRADVLVHPPIGYRGSTSTTASLTSSGATPGDCPPQTSVEHGIWARYRLGADAVSAA